MMPARLIIVALLAPFAVPALRTSFDYRTRQHGTFGPCRIANQVGELLAADIAKWNSVIDKARISRQ